MLIFFPHFSPFRTMRSLILELHFTTDEGINLFQILEVALSGRNMIGQIEPMKTENENPKTDNSLKETNLISFNNKSYFNISLLEITPNSR